MKRLLCEKPTANMIPKFKRLNNFHLTSGEIIFTAPLSEVLTGKIKQEKE